MPVTDLEFEAMERERRQRVADLTGRSDPGPVQPDPNMVALAAHADAMAAAAEKTRRNFGEPGRRSAPPPPSDRPAWDVMVWLLVGDINYSEHLSDLLRRVVSEAGGANVLHALKDLGLISRMEPASPGPDSR